MDVSATLLLRAGHPLPPDFGSSSCSRHLVRAKFLRFTRFERNSLLITERRESGAGTSGTAKLGRHLQTCYVTRYGGRAVELWYHIGRKEVSGPHQYIHRVEVDRKQRGAQSAPPEPIPSRAFFLPARTSVAYLSRPKGSCSCCRSNCTGPLLPPAPVL